MNDTVQIGTCVPENGSCRRCGKELTLDNCSKLDASFCSECLHDVEITEKTYTKTEEEWDELTDTLYQIPRGCKKISFNGADWAYYTAVINKSTDEELAASYQFNRAIVSAIELEMTQRTVAKFQALRGQVVIKRTTETKTTKTTKQVKPLDASMIMKMVQKGNMTPDQIKDLMNQLLAMSPPPKPSESEGEAYS